MLKIDPYSPPLTLWVFPPGGWQFIEPRDGWRLPDPTSTSFAQAAALLCQHRRGNPALFASVTEEDCELDILAQNRSRLGMPVQDLQKKKESLPPGPIVTTPADKHRAGALEEAVRRVRAIGKGAAVLADWFGHGGFPVAYTLAANRAEICAACPRNVSSDWLANVTGWLADFVHQQLKLRNELELRTPWDAKLKTCELCGCHLTLKIWAPAQYVQQTLTEAMRHELPSPCWMPKS